MSELAILKLIKTIQRISEAGTEKPKIYRHLHLTDKGLGIMQDGPPDGFLWHIENIAITHVNGDDTVFAICRKTPALIYYKFFERIDAALATDIHIPDFKGQSRVISHKDQLYIYNGGGTESVDLWVYEYRE